MLGRPLVGRVHARAADAGEHLGDNGAVLAPVRGDQAGPPVHVGPVTAKLCKMATSNKPRLLSKVGGAVPSNLAVSALS